MNDWHVIQTIGQRERWVGAELQRAVGLTWYVPMEKRKITNRAKAIEQLRPLMPGYLFVEGLTAGVVRDINETRHVIDILTLDDDTPAPVRGHEIAAIRRLEAAHNKQLEDWRTFRPGDRVRAKDGPFGSIESLLRSVRGSTATIEVPMLGSIRQAHVKLADLEKVA